VCTGTGSGINCATQLTTANLPNTAVLRDASGNINLGDVTASGDFNYASARTRYLTISAAAFTAGSTNFSQATYATATSPLRAMITSSGPHFLKAPVQLPNNAWMREWSCLVYDASGTYNVSMTMYELPSLSVVESTLWGTMVSSSSTGATTVTTGSVNFQVNPTSAYHLRVAPTNTLCGDLCQVYQCQIRYDVAAPE
jgi:hypothetical protein